MVIKDFKIKITKWNENSLFKMTFFSDAINAYNLNEKENKQRYENIKDYSMNDGIFKISLKFKYIDCQRGDYKGVNG